jgi:hypothetical protein
MLSLSRGPPPNSVSNSTFLTLGISCARDLQCATTSELFDNSGTNDVPASCSEMRRLEDIPGRGPGLAFFVTLRVE